MLTIADVEVTEMRVDAGWRWPWRQRETLIIRLLDEAIEQSLAQSEEARLVTAAVIESNGTRRRST